LFSANANRSQQVMREVERAVSKGVPIIPFRIEDVVPTEEMEYFISSSHWLDALTPPLEAHLNKLASSISSLINLEARQNDIAPTNRFRLMVHVAQFMKSGTLCCFINATN